MNIFIPNEHDRKEVVFNQFFEVGDILFIEPIYRHYDDLGYVVIAPINKEYMWVKEYIPYVAFKDKANFKYGYEVVEQPNDGRLHIPLRFAHPLYRGFELHYGDDRKNWMRDKYLFLGLGENLWRTMKFERNDTKENELLAHLDPPQRYNLVNPYFGGSFEKINIRMNNDLPVIKMRKIEGFTLLDWMKVIEYAENIYTAETSLIYLLESFPIEANEIHLYPRYPFLENVDYIKDYLQKQNWVFHDYTDLQ